MSTASDALGLLQDPEGSLQPSVPINANADAVGALLAGAATRTLTADANYTLVAADYRVATLALTSSALTAGRDIVFPAHFPPMLVVNDTGQTLTLKKSGQTGVTVDDGESIRVNCGPTDVLASTVGGSGGELPDGDYDDITVSGGGTALNLRFTGTSFDNDATLAANSASKLATQQAIKTYVDAKVAGLSWKQAVRVASTANGTLASAYENGDTVDGVTLATGDRILLKDQTTGSENGIYVVNATGAPTRATDADSGAKLVNASVYVSEGTANADKQFVCTTNSPITVGSTSLTFTVLATGGGFTNFTDGLGNTSPNATVPVSYLLATNGASNVDAAIMPKGSGALLAVPSSGSINKRGAYAVDFNRLSYSSAYVASGSYSFAAGASMASADFTLAIGYANRAQQTYAIALGCESVATGDTAVAIGNGAAASGTYSVALGKGASANAEMSVSMGGDRPKVRGIVGAAVFGFWQYQRQRQFLGLYLTTYDATPTVAKANSSAAGTTNQLVLPNQSVFAVKALVTARHNSSGDCAAWEITAMVKRHTNAGSTTIVGTPTKTLLGADAGASAWDVAVSADTTNGALAYTCTGDTSRTTEWTIDTYSVQAVFS